MKNEIEELFKLCKHQSYAAIQSMYEIGLSSDDNIFIKRILDNVILDGDQVYYLAKRLGDLGHPANGYIKRAARNGSALAEEELTDPDSDIPLAAPILEDRVVEAEIIGDIDDFEEVE